jgi:putative ABC transport system permease protein
VFNALGLNLLQGRKLTDRDAESSESVAVISSQVAQKLFDRPDAVGQIVQVQDFRTPGASSTAPWHSATIVGIVADVDVGTPGSRERGLLIAPLRDPLDARLIVGARMADGPAASATWLRDVVSRIDRDLPLVEVRTGASLLNVETMFARVGSILTSSLGLLALLLGLVGLSGVLAHNVASRTREIGIRMALGAERQAVLSMVMSDGMRPALAGLAIGAVISFPATRVLGVVGNRLGGVPVSAIIGIPIVFIGAGLLACFMPARRAARVDPNVALRDL